MREKPLSRKPLLLLLCAIVLVSACHHAPIRRRAASQDALPAITAEDLFVLAMNHVHRSDLLRAEQYLIVARQKGYDEPSAVFWLVRVCVAAGRYHSALRHAASYLRDHPSNLSLRLVVASIHEALGDDDRAQSELESLVLAAPRWGLPHYRLGMLYRTQVSGTERARPHLEQYLKLDPNGPHAEEVRTALRDDALIRTGPQLLAQPTQLDLQAEELP